MPKVAYIKWLDASGSRQTWSVANLGKLMPTVNQSAGILVLEDEGRVTIAQDIWDDTDGEKLTRDVETIPRSYIISMKTWEVK